MIIPILSTINYKKVFFNIASRFIKSKTNVAMQYIGGKKDYLADKSTELIDNIGKAKDSMSKTAGQVVDDIISTKDEIVEKSGNFISVQAKNFEGTKDYISSKANNIIDKFSKHDKNDEKSPEEKQNEKMEMWNSLILHARLPEILDNEYKIINNTEDVLELKVYKNAEEYKDYVQKCKEKGFTLEAKEEDKSYYALSDEGFSISIKKALISNSYNILIKNTLSDDGKEKGNILDNFFKRK